MKIWMVLAIVVASLSLYACRSSNPIQRADNVNIDAFMGDWYVIGHIPTFIEKDAYNPLETYQRGQENKVNTTFSFNKDSFAGERKTYRPTGFIQPESNAYWKMQFLWPFKSEFIISYVDDAYEHTIIGRSKRDYLWIMARQPHISEDQYQQLVERAVKLGYSREDIIKTPQQSLEIQKTK
ncbi:lipocalin family protein [Marinicella gelatinilytica]|uniref:lipocalin family protein n=1 Tax=Marinicella gelatinilytica TaxID=2996017 RepID=UPI002260BFBA|nr:lipocalin family protein [Marinicella gelatinilytica]MCX7545320.1 lipocalin family protein [Marinicella gelatinilytica]